MFLYSKKEADLITSDLQNRILIPLTRVWSEIQDSGQFLLICIESVDKESSVDFEKVVDSAEALMLDRHPLVQGKASWMVIAMIDEEVVYAKP